MQQNLGSETPDPSLVRQTMVAGRYAVEGELGAGGMGVVYRARDLAEDRVVALKQLKSSQVGEQRAQLEALFEREYHTLARLRHPSIIEVYDYGIGAEGPFYVMELLSGDDMGDVAPLPYRDACRHLRDIASSLALLHNHGLVHRDVSPRNVRFSDEGRAKLLDFGALASFGRSDAVIGTPPFVAPEVLRQMPVDQRADLYALGALAYWLLTGRHAFPARVLHDLPVLWQQAPSPWPRSSKVPQELSDLVASLLNVDPFGRPHSAADVIERLGAVAGLPPVEVTETAQGHLLSAELVGRQAERAWLARRLKRVEAGRGAGAVVEGESGAGKTRLLDELALQAQLKGVRVLKVDARAVSGNFSTAAALAEAALTVCPDAARKGAHGHEPQLGHLSARVREGLGVEQLAVPSQDPSERRARMQGALHAWFGAIAGSLPTMLVVDNIDASDEASAALLAVLSRDAHRRPLLVLTSHQPVDADEVTASLGVLRGNAEVMPLPGLSEQESEGYKQGLVERAERSQPFAEGPSALSPSIVHVRTAREIHSYVVDLIAEKTHAREVHLYMWDGEEMKLTRSNAQSEPPPDVQRALQRKAEAAILQAQLTDASVTQDMGEEAPSGETANDNGEGCEHQVQTHLLSTWVEDQLVVLGGLASSSDARINPQWLAVLATVIHQRGDLIAS